MDKKKTILSTALKLFVEFGFHGTPTLKIAKEAGVANGTLFHYFPTKEELILAVYVDGKTRMAEYITENIRPEPTLKANMKAQYLGALYWAIDNRADFSYMQQFNSSPYHALIKDEEVAKYSRAHLDMLKKGIKEKVIKPLPVEYMDALINSLTYGLTDYLAANSFSKAKQHQLISDTFELMWGMFAT